MSLGTQSSIQIQQNSQASASGILPNCPPGAAAQPVSLVRGSIGTQSSIQNTTKQPGICQWFLPTLYTRCSCPDCVLGQGVIKYTEQYSKYNKTARHLPAESCPKLSTMCRGSLSTQSGIWCTIRRLEKRKLTCCW